MKKLIFLMAFAFIGYCANAQVKPTLVTTTSYTKTLDTVVNAGAKVTTAFPIGAWKAGVTVQVIVTKISGTVGGSLGLYGSMDGTNFTLIGSAATPSDASANYSFNTTVCWKYYRVGYTGTGTMSASFKTYVLPY